LIDDLLKCLRGFAGKVYPLKIAPVSFLKGGGLSRQSKLCKLLCDSPCPVQIRSKLSEVPNTSGDSVRLQQVQIWNLLTNAVKFTPSAAS